MPKRRQLAAIMFTDIEGYTSTMQQSEQKAIAWRDRHRLILQEAHEKFNGRIVQFYGDGTLSIFQSAVEAVECAVGMQQAFCRSPQVPVRMGIHIGDITFDDEQVFGDGINLASRIESLSVAGCVLISDKVKDEINNHPEFKTVSVGTYQLKNINRSVEVFALDHDGLVLPLLNSLKGKTEEKKETTNGTHKKTLAKSIAVLPFVNISNDPEQEYFSAGIAEEILNSLSGIKELKVAGRTSSSQFNRENSGLREIGEKLGVSSILEGSVRKQGNRIRITVQLVDVDDGFHLWSEKYDRNMDDIFAIQDEVALAVTEKLKVTLLENDRARISRNYTQNTEAYELYLKGRFYMNRRGTSIMTGIHYFELAIDLDPGFALAYTGFADASLTAAFYGLVPPKEIVYKAKQAAETALKLDPSLCEPYCSLGFYYTIFEWNWEEAEKNFLRCIELNPSYAQAHYWYGVNFFSWVKNDWYNGEKQGKIALELEPFSAICFGTYGAILHTFGKYKEALEACKTGIALDPNTFICHLFAAWSYMGLKQYEDAIETFIQLMKFSNRHHFAVNGLILTYCMMGNFEEARILLDELKERSAKEYIGWTVTALSMAFLGEPDTAFEYLEKAYNNRESVLLTLKYQLPVPDTLKQDPRFQYLLERIGYPQ
jgi:adenylate cyclase